MGSNQKKGIIKYLVLALYIILVGIFFFFTLRSGEESAQESSIMADALYKLLRFITFKKVDFDYDIIHHITRKLVGHYGYNVFIGLTGYLAFYLLISKNDGGKIALVISSGLGLIIAGLGELLQYIPDSRGPSFVDGVFNFLGEVTGILLIYVIVAIMKNKKEAI